MHWLDRRKLYALCDQEGMMIAVLESDAAAV